MIIPVVIIRVVLVAVIMNPIVALQAILATALEMNSADHKWVGSSMHDRLVGALETCCRQGEMLRIQNRHVDWEQHQIAIPGSNAKDAENRRIPFDPQGRLALILTRRASLGPNAYVFGTESGEFQQSVKTALGGPASALEWARDEAYQAGLLGGSRSRQAPTD